MSLNYTGSSYFPAKNFTRSPIHFDWMVGVEKYNGFKDSITGEKIKRFSSILWNKTLMATVLLETYDKLKSSNDPIVKHKLEELGLPNDLVVK